MTPRVLFVCLGNICRSPTAEAVFRQRAAQAGLVAETDSAGTGDWHIGEPPYAPAIEAALKRGYDLRSLRARQITPQDFLTFSHILVMDRSNLHDCRALCPATGTAPRLLLDYSATPGQDIADPWFTRAFDTTLTQIETGVSGLISALQAAA